MVRWYRDGKIVTMECGGGGGGGETLYTLCRLWL